MKKSQMNILSIIAMLSLVSPAFAKDNLDTALQGVRLGMAIDRGLGIVATLKRFNLFVGNDGAALDYIFKKDTVNTSLNGPVYWYLGGGVFGDWKSGGDKGIRVPVGLEWHFKNRLDGYAQLNPYLRVNRDTKFELDAAFGVRYQF